MKPSPLVHLIDDDAAVRDALTLMLQSRGLRVRAYRSAPAFLEQSKSKRSGCVVADMHMPNMTGVDLLAKMRALDIALPVVIITASAGAPLAREAMKAGASDLLEKPFDDETLLAAVRRMLAADGGDARDAEKRAMLARFAALSAEEKDVLEGLAEGRPNQDIARALGVGLRAVELHRANIMAKANVRTLVELVRMSLIASSADEPPREGADAPPSRSRRRRSSLRGAAAA